MYKQRCPQCKKTAIHCYCNSFNGDGTLKKYVIKASKKVNERIEFANKRYGYRFKT